MLIRPRRICCKQVALVLLIIFLPANVLAAEAASSQDPLLRPGEMVWAGAALATSIKFDQPWSQAWRLSPETPAYRLAEGISKVGDSSSYAVVLPLLYLADKPLGERAITAVGVAQLATYASKVLTGRQRPNMPEGQGLFTGLSWRDEQHSFPSGHTTAAFALATVLSRTDASHSWAYYTGATLIGLSRITLGYHWPSDVLIGALLGVVVGRWVF